MLQLIKRLYILAVKIYHNTRDAVIGNALHISSDSRERCNTQLLFDYLFFHLLLLVPVTIFGLYTYNTTELLLTGTFFACLASCLLLVRSGVSIRKVSFIAALVTLVLPAICSLLNSQDLSLRYTMIWSLSILFCYITTNITATLILGGLLCSYLSLVAWMKINNVSTFVTTGFTHEQNLIFTPVLAAFYIIFLIRVLGAHYKNIFISEHERTLEKQRQHSSLLSQRLTKQFIILKGLSRSGKSKYLDGNRELLEACLIEIEKQCECAINYLDNSSHQEQ